MPLCEPDLRLDDVDPGNRLGYGVLDLNTWVHFDEIELAAVGVLQKLYCSSIFIARAAAQRQSGLTQRFTLFRAHEQRRRTLDDLLVPALHRAVALEQVHQLSVFVGEHLNLDVTRTPHELF